MFGDSPVILIDAGAFLAGVTAVVAAIGGAAWKIASSTSGAITAIGNKIAPILINLNNIVAIITDRYEIELEENARLRTLIREKDAHRLPGDSSPP